MGKNCNIGCGVVFTNYNGRQKNKIIIDQKDLELIVNVLLIPVLVSYFKIVLGTASKEPLLSLLPSSLKPCKTFSIFEYELYVSF